MSEANEMLMPLVEMFAARARGREQAAGRRWAALTRREQKLVREAAVMGWVQGKMASRVPSDALIIQTVLEAVASHQDLYPTLAGLAKD